MENEVNDENHPVYADFILRNAERQKNNIQ